MASVCGARVHPSNEHVCCSSNYLWKVAFAQKSWKLHSCSAQMLADMCHGGRWGKGSHDVLWRTLFKLYISSKIQSKLMMDEWAWKLLSITLSPSKGIAFNTMGNPITSGTKSSLKSFQDFCKLLLMSSLVLESNGTTWETIEALYDRNIQCVGIPHANG